MSAAPARLELVPSSAPPSPFPVRPAPAPPMTAAERNARTATARRVFLRLWITGCAVVPVAALFGETMGEALAMTLVLLGVLVMPASGLALWCILIYARSREAVHAVLAATFALVAAVALIEPAIDASREMYVARRQVELDALAADIRRAVPGEAAVLDPKTTLDARLNERFAARLSAAGMGSVGRVDGGMVFVTPWGSRLLYADGVAGERPACDGPRLRALGGRWFELECGK